MRVVSKNLPKQRDALLHNCSGLTLEHSNCESSLSIRASLGEIEPESFDVASHSSAK